MNKPAPAGLKQWADTPFPLIETPKHKEGKTGYTDPYMERPNVQPADYKDFIGYSLCWYSVVHEHHTSEEDQFFPDIENAVGVKGLLDGDVQQHKSFQKGLDEYCGYLEGLAGKEARFNAIQLNSIISSFAPALCHHLTSEIGSLLALSKYGDKLPIQDLWNKEGKQTVMAMTKFNALPFFFLNLDVTHEDSLWKDWPPIPSPAKWIIDHCFTLWHAGYWKFASCDRSGIPKPLYATGPHQ